MRIEHKHSSGGWLEWLGLLTRAHPWTVSVGALAVALVAAFALLGARALVESALVESAKGEVSEQRFEIAFQAKDEEGEPLSGVEIGTGRQSFGITTETGNLRVVVQARQNQMLPVEVTCPPRYAEPDTPYALRLASKRRIGTVQSIAFDVLCRRQAREVVQGPQAIPIETMRLEGRR